MALIAGGIKESAFVYPISVVCTSMNIDAVAPVMGFTQLTAARTTGGTTEARATFYDVDGQSLGYYDIPNTGSNSHTIPSGAVYLKMSRSTATFTLTP